jgi:hypothetical protein
MNAQERVNNIDSFVEKKGREKMTKAENERLEIKRLVDEIKELQPRINDLLIVGNACLFNKIPLKGTGFGCKEGYDTHQFITNVWSHLLGFVDKSIAPQKLPFMYLGIQGGGFYTYNLKTDGRTVYVSGSDGRDKIHVLNRFVKEFDRFEKEFYAYVDSVTK